MISQRFWKLGLTIWCKPWLCPSTLVGTGALISLGVCLLFSRPDLGPKMYSAYGSPLTCTKGTTNLHLDMSDAVNVMIYVGIPKEGNTQELLDGNHFQFYVFFPIESPFLWLLFTAELKAIKESGCDHFSIKRTRDAEIGGGGDVPGAIWHIYEAKDADSIRDFLIKVFCKWNLKWWIATSMICVGLNWTRESTGAPSWSYSWSEHIPGRRLEGSVV